MIEVRQVQSAYGHIQALFDLNLTAQQGKITAILGANGAGKTTLLRVISGFAALKAGSILMEGRDISSMTAPARARAGIIHVFEGGRAFPDLTVLENLEIGAYTSARAEGEKRLAEIFELFPRLKERSSQRAGTLSGGERQMLVLGRALMANPRYLLLDEPSLGLAPKVIAAAFEKIVTVNRMGVSIVLVEQNAKVAFQICDYAYVLRGGRVVAEGTGTQIGDEATLKSAYLS